MAKDSDSISFWLNNAGRYPLLPAEETLRLARIIQSPESSERQKQAAINKIVTHNLRLIPRVVQRTCRTKHGKGFGTSITVDLLQSGVFGLKRAAELFDPTKGYAFSTYAMKWIFQSVQRFLVHNMSPVRVPENTIQEFFKLKYAEKGRDQPSDALKALSPEKVARYRDAYYALRVGSTDIEMSRPGGQGRAGRAWGMEYCLLDTIESPATNEINDTIEELVSLSGADSRMQEAVIDLYSSGKAPLTIAKAHGYKVKEFKKELEKCLRIIESKISGRI
jgi:RNA polymerase sigma factor (sigma-70 family)